MHDPFPIPQSPWLAKATQPFADFFALPTLPLHSHEVLIAASLYHFVYAYISPRISNLLWPQIYKSLNKRTRINWDVHVVSFVQSCLVNTMALWVMFNDQERAEMNWRGRIFGYTGATGLVQGFATGYFLWDLLISTYYLGAFGIGMWFHALAALTVFSLGFRPFLNYYGTTFILYELSSPFLNIHWFCDKLHMTGSNIQLINGIVLLSTFFFCRLCWGSFNSVRVFYDIFLAIRAHNITAAAGGAANTAGMDNWLDKVAGSEMMRFKGAEHVPYWLAGAYLASNILLNSLNIYWFSKMIETLRKRFDPPWGTRGTKKDLEVRNRRKTDADRVLVEGVDVETDEELQDQEVTVMRGVDSEGRTSVEVEGKNVRSRKRG